MKARWMVVLSMAAALLVGCGGDGQETTAKSSDRPPEAKDLRVTLARWIGPESAGAMTAYHRGYFADEDINIEILAPGSPRFPVKYVVQETDDLGLASQPQVMLAKQKGAPITVIGSLMPQSTTAMIWLKKSKIGGIADLKGKTIGFPGLPFQREFLESALARAGLTLDDVALRRVEYEMVSSLMYGEVDAIFGGSKNIEGIELESAGFDPVVTPVGSLGIPPYEELVWIARTDFVSRDPQLFRGFMSAMRRGTAAAVEDPETAAKVIDEAFETTPETGPEEMVAEVKATLPFLSKSGDVDPDRAIELVSWMRDQGMIRQEVPEAMLLTDWSGSLVQRLRYLSEGN